MLLSEELRGRFFSRNPQLSLVFQPATGSGAITLTSFL
jgi:hypothetical protein